MNTRGNPCAKGYNSSASQWLSGEQVRLCSGQPKVGTFWDHSGRFRWGGGGGGGGCTVGPLGSLTMSECCVSVESVTKTSLLPDICFTGHSLDRFCRFFHMRFNSLLLSFCHNFTIVRWSVHAAWVSLLHQCGWMTAFFRGLLV